MSIESFAYIDERIVSEVKREEIASFLQRASFLWVDLQDPDEADIEVLEDVFKFHELSIEDCIFPQNQPKLDEFEDYLFMVAHCLVNSDIEELDIFMGKNYLVSVHEREIPSLREAINKVKKREEYSPCFVLYSIFDVVVDGFLSLIDKLDIEIDKAAQEVVEKPSQDAITKVFSLRERVISLRKTILPQQVVINTLIKKPFSLIKEETIPYFKDIDDHINRINSLLEICRDNITHSLEVGFGNLSAQLAYTVKILTIIATFIMPLQLITGYYGMNVALPEFKMGLYGVFVVISLMVITPLVMFIYFRKKKWL